MSTTSRVPFLALLAAKTISGIGDALTMIAVPWFVLETTGSAAKTGIAGAVGAVPLLISGVFGGAIVDRLGYKRASVVADLLNGLTVGGIPLLHVTVGLAFWQLLTLVFLAGLLDTPGNAARMSMIPELARPAGVSLERANAAVDITYRIAILVGPPLAGLLIVGLGPEHTLWLDAASFLCSLALVATLVPGALLPAPAVEPDRHYVADVLDGARFIRRDPLVRAIVLFLAVSTPLDAAFYGVILPVYAHDVFGSAVDLGLLYTSSAVGALAGGVLYGWRGARWSRRWTFLGCSVVVTLPFWLFVARPPLPLAIVAYIVEGIASAPLWPIVSIVFQQRAPTAMRGRVFGMASGVSYAAIPLGRIAVGLLIAGPGLTVALLAVAITYVAATVALGCLPAMREIDRPVETIPKESRVSASLIDH